MQALNVSKDVYYSGQDRDGGKVVTVVIRKHVKNTTRRDARRLLVYHLEMIDIEQQGRQVTIVIDAANAGLR